MAEQVLIQNLPCYLQYEALNPKNIVVSDVSEVHFNFLLLNTEKFGKCNLADVQMRLAESMKVLFKPELKKDAMPKLKDFVEGLQEKDYLSYSQIFGDYRRLYEFMVPLADEALPDKGSLLLRLWEQFKRCSNVLKRVLYTTVIAVLIGMIIYIIIKPETVSNDKVQFDQIGTLKIQQENGDRDESW